MKTTEKRLWSNGHYIRGNRFHSIAWTMLNYGFLLSIQLRKKKYFKFDIYKLK